MRKQLLVGGFVPGVALIGFIVGGLLWSVQRRAEVPEDVRFAVPIVKSLNASGVAVGHVWHATHYELRRSVAAGIETNRGYVVVLQFENEGAAQAGLREARAWCCTRFYFTLDNNRVVFSDNPNLDDVIKRFLSRSPSAS
jgi:hypothetical protein